MHADRRNGIITFFTYVTPFSSQTYIHTYWGQQVLTFASVPYLQISLHIWLTVKCHHHHRSLLVFVHRSYYNFILIYMHESLFDVWELCVHVYYLHANIALKVNSRNMGRDFMNFDQVCKTCCVSMSINYHHIVIFSEGF